MSITLIKRDQINSGGRSGRLVRYHREGGMREISITGIRIRQMSITQIYRDQIKSGRRSGRLARYYRGGRREISITGGRQQAVVSRWR